MNPPMKTDVVEVLGDLVVRTQQAKLSIVRVNLPEALRPLMAAGGMTTRCRRSVYGCN
jgi:hypothetical protein